MADPYVYPDTNILINKEDIRDPDALENFERRMTLQRIREGYPEVEISSAGYRELHQHIFQDVYEWAGKDRIVNIAKSDSYFCRAEYVSVQLDKQFVAIKGENELKGLTQEQFAARAAEHVSELNAIHPFREGNGRTQRAFLEVLSANAGHNLDLSRIDPKAWNEASIRSFQDADYEPMRKVISGAILERTTEREQESPTNEKQPDLLAERHARELAELDKAGATEDERKAALERMAKERELAQGPIIDPAELREQSRAQSREGGGRGHGDDDNR